MQALDTCSLSIPGAPCLQVDPLLGEAREAYFSEGEAIIAGSANLSTCGFADRRYPT